MILFIQKTIIRIMAGIKTKVSGRILFRDFSILRLASEFLFSALTFVMDNMKNVQTNSDIQDKRIRHRCDVDLPSANLTITKPSVAQESSYSLSFHQPLNV
jgi:hypothetical protein